MKIKNVFGKVLYEDDSELLIKSVENAIKEKTNLGGADLRGANLYGADLTNAKGLGTFIETLEKAILLAPQIFTHWQETSLAETAEKFGGITPDGPKGRALVKIHHSLDGGFCYVLSRKQIWWWNWHCPSPDTVLVLWKEGD